MRQSAKEVIYEGSYLFPNKSAPESSSRKLGKLRTFVDLFCGIGGFRVALESRGMRCVFSSDIDEKARRAYHGNFGEFPAGDITKIRSMDIPGHDVLCAGFPCQPFSLSGKFEGFADPRGRLFFEVIRIAKCHRPSILLLENVRNILTIDNGRVIREIHRSLDSAGYNLEKHVLNAGDFGAPQRRLRVYFVAVRKDLGFAGVEPKPTSEKRYVRNILLPNDLCQDLITDRKDVFIGQDASEPSLRPIQIGYLNKGGQGERIYSVEGHAITQSATSGGVGRGTGLYFVDNKIRRLHIDESKLVMGFSARHKVSDGLEGYKQLGNSVVPSVVNAVYESVRLV